MTRSMFGVVAFFSFVLTMPAGGAQKGTSAEWMPVTAEELALKESPTGPGSPAILLYREHVMDDPERFETVYFRIKISIRDSQVRA